MPGTLKSQENTLSWQPRKFANCCAFNLFFGQNTFFNKGYFIQVAFKNIQGLLSKIQGLFKDILQFFNFQGLFKARANQETVLKLLSSWTLHNLLLALRKGGFQCTVVNLYCRFKDQTQVHGLPSGFFIFLVANHISFTEIRNWHVIFIKNLLCLIWQVP